MKKLRFLLCLLILFSLSSLFFVGCEKAVSPHISDKYEEDPYSLIVPPSEEAIENAVEAALPPEESTEGEQNEEGLHTIPTEEATTPHSADEKTLPAEEETLFRPPTNEFECYVAACATTAVRVRRGAGTDYGVLFTLSAGDSLPYLWREGDWLAVWTGERVGYLFAAYAYLSQTNEAIEGTIRAGLAKLGTPYEWGAPRLLDDEGNRNPYFSGKSFDCSSFVQYCYYVGMGIKLGNYTGSQADYTVGKRITSYADLRRGDFYFTGNGSISHVVIYLGGGMLLQTYSANGGPVSVTTDAKWKSKFLSGRRPDPTVIEQFR